MNKANEENDFFIDPQRCIGCKACVAACGECATHRGISMIHLDFFDREDSVKTAPMVCMHCDDPSCAAVCPADAIKRTEDGVVQSSLSPRCIGCSNCQIACPFGVDAQENHPGLDPMLYGRLLHAGNQLDFANVPIGQRQAHDSVFRALGDLANGR